MERNIKLALSREEMESLGMNDKDEAKVRGRINFMLVILEGLQIGENEIVKVSKWFEEGEGKRWKPYIAGMSYQVLEKVENKLTDFLAYDKAYRFNLLTRSGSLEPVPLTSHRYLTVIEDVVLKNPRLPRQYLSTCDLGKVEVNPLIQSMDFSDCDTADMDSMKDMFFMKLGIKHLNTEKFVTDKITNMDSMFSLCSSLRTLDLSTWDVSNVTSMWGMFNGCERLTTLDLSGWKLSTKANMYGMFIECTSLKKVYMLGCDKETVATITLALSASGVTAKIITKK